MSAPFKAPESEFASRNVWRRRASQIPGTQAKTRAEIPEVSSASRGLRPSPGRRTKSGCLGESYPSDGPKANSAMLGDLLIRLG